MTVILFHYYCFAAPVEFMPSLEGFPDTPKWVKFFQKSEFDNAYLYGTPDTDASDSNLEVSLSPIGR